MTVCSVTVDINLGEISSCEMIEELESRGVLCFVNFGKDSAQAMFDAFKIGNVDEAMRIARKIAEASTGGILT
jgi:hypothetical protein